MCGACYERARLRGDLKIRSTDPVERFWSHVEKSSTCWNWTGAKAHGYGRYRWMGRADGAHRVAYQLLAGPIPDGLELDHLCRNRACVRPDHLDPVTARVNLLRGVSAGAMNANKRHCPQGHWYTPGNTITRPGGRHCRACTREQSSARALRQKQERAARIRTDTCVECGAAFEHPGRPQRLCSNTCRLEAGRRASREHQRRKRTATQTAIPAVTANKKLGFVPEIV